LLRVTGSQKWWGRYILCLSLLLGFHLSYGGYFTSIPTSTVPKGSSPELIGVFLERAWQGHDPAGAELDPLLSQRGLCWVIGFRGGYPVSSHLSLWEKRSRVLSRFLAAPDLHEMEAVEVGVATDVLPYDHEIIQREDVGLWGLLFRCSTGDLCLSPAEFSRWGEFPDGQSSKYTAERTVLKQAKFRDLSWVLRRDRGFVPMPLTRGDLLVPLSTANREGIEASARAAAAYEQRMVHQYEGQLPFLYKTVSGVRSEEGRSLVSLCMGSLSLSKFARYTGAERDRKISDQNLKTMIARYGHTFNQQCYIADSDDCALGAQALFALAIRSQPHPGPTLVEFEHGLARTIQDSLQPDGHFETDRQLPGSPPQSAVDPEKDENQLVFPGLALAYLCERAQAERVVVDLRPLDLALKYYEDRFQRRPDKSAIPWLVEALWQRYQIDRDPQSAERAMSLIDWNLNNLQQWAKMDPEARGAMINPEAVRYGPVCYSYQVGAQLQGLVAGTKLARALGDNQHEARFEEAITEASRFLIQLQFKNSGDLYWLPPSLRGGPQGAIRDCLWNQNIQIDSCGSALNAWMDLLRPEVQHG
jgi:hypothetical protein